MEEEQKEVSEAAPAVEGEDEGEGEGEEPQKVAKSIDSGDILDETQENEILTHLKEIDQKLEEYETKKIQARDAFNEERKNDPAYQKLLAQQEEEDKRIQREKKRQQQLLLMAKTPRRNLQPINKYMVHID